MPPQATRTGQPLRASGYQASGRWPVRVACGGMAGLCASPDGRWPETGGDEAQ